MREEYNISGQLFGSTQALVALFNPGKGTFLQANGFGLRMFEVKDEDEFTSFYKSGKIWFNPPEDLPAYVANIEETVDKQGFLEKEMLYQTASGKKFWGSLRVDRLDINHEKHLLVRIVNIDHLKNTALVALRNAQQFESLFNNSTIGIVITNKEGIIINMNPFAEKQFGYSKEEIMGKAVEELIPLQFKNSHKLQREQFIQSPQNRPMGAGRDLFARRKNNSEFPVEISLSHFDIQGENYAIAFIIDISVRKSNEMVVLRQKDELEKFTIQVKQLNLELEKKVEDRTKMLKETLVELEKSKEELRIAFEKEKELGELKSRFVTMASHEFRTPLSTILSSSFIAKQYTAAGDQDKREKHMQRIQHAVQTLTFILEDFLSLEKLEKGLVHVAARELGEQELVAEIETTLDEMKNILKRGQSFQFSHTALPAIVTDKNLLHNILVNLISNAIKYSPEDTPIEVAVHEAEHVIKISITDHGIGIPEADQKHLFERFFRATNASNIQGTGLGLHIVSSYLKLIRGGIEVKSQTGKGTTFAVLLDTKAVL